MLRDGAFYPDLVPSHFDRGTAEARVNRLVRQIAHLGFASKAAPLLWRRFLFGFAR
jgi:hypothetical protein